GGADGERPRGRAEPIRHAPPQDRGGRRDDLLRKRHRADLLAGKPQPAQVRSEVRQEGPDARVIKEVEPPQPRDHCGLSSGSNVQSSGKAAFSASAIVCCCFVSAISKVYTPATAMPWVCACSMIEVASESDLPKTSFKTST